MRLIGAPSGGGKAKSYNTRVAVLGDSIAYGNSFSDFTGGNGYTKFYAKGYVNWAAFLGRQRWTFDPEDNFGVAGNHTGEVLVRTDAALAATTADTIIIDCMTNDQANGVSVAQSKINYQAIIDKCLARGKRLILVPMRPRDITATGLTMTTAQLLRFLQLRDWIHSLHSPVRNIYVCDMWKYVANPASTNGAMRTNFTYDGLHPSVQGAYWCGLALAELLGLGTAPGLFPYRDVLIGSNSDVYNSVDNTRGALNTNPMMQGGSTVATGWTAGSASGVVAGVSKIASPASQGRSDVQQVALQATPTGNGDVYDVYQTIPSANLAVGDVVRAFADITYDKSIGITSHGLVMVDTSNFNRNAGFLVDSTDINSMDMPNLVGVSGVMRTPKFTLPVNNTIRLGMKTRVRNGVGVDLQYRIHAMYARKAS